MSQGGRIPPSPPTNKINDLDGSLATVIQVERFEAPDDARAVNAAHDLEHKLKPPEQSAPLIRRLFRVSVLSLSESLFGCPSQSSANLPEAQDIQPCGEGRLVWR
jgi:hypothetical protein